MELPMEYNNNINIRIYIALLYHLSMISKRFTELLIISHAV